MASPRAGTQIVFESTAIPQPPPPRAPLVTERFFGEALADAVQTKGDFESLEVPWRNERRRNNPENATSSSRFAPPPSEPTYPLPPPTTQEVLKSLMALEQKSAALDKRVRGMHYAPSLVSDMERIMADYMDNAQKNNRIVEALEGKVDTLVNSIRSWGTNTVPVDTQQASHCCSQLRAVRPMKAVVEMAVMNLRALDAIEQEWPVIKAGVETGVATNLKRKRELDSLEATVVAMEKQLEEAETGVETMFEAFRKEVDGVL